MFGEVILIYIKKLTLSLNDFLRIFPLQPAGHAFRHTTYDKVMVIRIKKTSMENVFDALPFGKACIITIKPLIFGFEKFREVQWPDFEDINHTDGIRLRLSQQSSKQATCGYNMILTSFFFEVLEAIQSLRAFLYFVEND